MNLQHFAGGTTRNPGWELRYTRVERRERAVLWCRRAWRTRSTRNPQRPYHWDSEAIDRALREERRKDETP